MMIKTAATFQMVDRDRYLDAVITLLEKDPQGFRHADEQLPGGEYTCRYYVFDGEVVARVIYKEAPHEEGAARYVNERYL